MKAIRITDRGGPEVLRLVDAPAPVPGASEIQVRVRAFSLNRADLLQCLGLYPAPPDAPQDIPGLEYAGEVCGVGARVCRWREGDRVMGLVGGGAFAEQLVVHEREALPIPGALSFTQAAAVPEAYATAFDALVLQGHLRSGERLLIHAAASGVGTAAAQLGAALGCTVVGTLRSAHKAQACRALGVGHVVLCPEGAPAFAAQVREHTGGRGADVVLDLVGASYAEQTLEALAQRGRWLLVGVLGGVQASLNLAGLLHKRIQLVGSVLRSRPLEEKILLARAFEQQLLPLFEQGRLRPVVDRELPAAQVQQAFEALATNQPVGKIVLAWN